MKSPISFLKLSGMPLVLNEEFLRKLELLRIAIKKSASIYKHGDVPARKKGGTIEFHSHDPYSQGEEFKNIDWAIYARLEELFIKQFVYEKAISLDLIIDSSVSMNYGDPNKWDIAVKLSSIICYIVLSDHGIVKLYQTANNEILSFNGGSDIAKCLKVLNNLKPKGNFDLDDFMKRFKNVQTSSAAKIMISDFWLDSPKELLRSMKAISQSSSSAGNAANKISMIQILSPQEIVPDMSGSYILKDLEKNISRKLHIDSETLIEYKEKVTEYINDFEKSCKNYEFTYAKLISNSSLEEFCLIIMRRSGVLI